MPDRIRVWDLPVRVFHWLLAGSFALAYLVAESERFRALHVILGYTATGLILFRLLWGVVGSRFARFGSFMFSAVVAVGYLRSLAKQPQHYIGHIPAGSYAIYGILVTGLATGVTGYLTLKDLGGEPLEEVHEACANVWLGLVIVHIVGVFVGSWIHRENLVGAMITGYKRGAGSQSSEASSQSKPARLVGVALATGVAVFWIWSLLTGSVPGANPQRTHAERANELP